MNKYKVFILDSDVELIGKIKSKIYNSSLFKTVGTASSPMEALRKIKVIGEIDLLITDLFINNDENEAFLEKIKNNKSYKIKKIIALSDVYENEIFKNLNSYNIDFFFIKPCDLKSLLYIMKIVCKGTSNEVIKRYIDSFNECSRNDLILHNDQNDKTRIEERVTILLHSVGIPAHIKGYVYIRCAVIESFYNPNFIGQITKTLYPEIARRYTSTPSRVERAIRHAIEIAWNRGSIDLINKIFGYTINAYKAKPTNSEFIAMITDKLRLELKAGILL